MRYSVLFVTNVLALAYETHFFVALNTTEYFTCSMGVQCLQELAVNDKG